jgi:hypothetical protein
MELAKEVIMVISVVVFLIIVEPLITFVVFVVLGGATGCFCTSLKRKCKEYGKREQVYRRDHDQSRGRRPGRSERGKGTEQGGGLYSDVQGDRVLVIATAGNNQFYQAYSQAGN